MKKLIIIAALALASCGTPSLPHGGEQDSDHRPGNGGAPEQPAPDDWADALSDRSPRYQSAAERMAFDDGGVFYIVDGDSHRFVDLARGRTVVFEPGAQRLRIDNDEVAVEQCVRIGRDGGISWYALQPGRHIVVVEENYD